MHTNSSFTLDDAKKLEYKDDKKAFDIYRRFAEDGDAEGQCRCGQMLLQGRGTERDFVQAISWFKLADQAQYSEARESLSSLESKIEQLKLMANLWCEYLSQMPRAC